MTDVSFVKTAEEVNFFQTNAGWLNNSEGIYTTWATKPECIQKVLPPALKMVAPIVSSYVINVHEPTFSKSYKEAAIMVPVMYNDKPGVYTLSMLLDGTDNGVFQGREVIGIPKKNGDIQITRLGNHAKATVERYGARVFEVECEIGEYNTPKGPVVFGEIGPGTKAGGICYFYKFDMDQGEDAKINFSNLRLNQVETQRNYRSWEPATAKVSMQPSVNDPWAELEVVQVLGAGWAHLDIGMPGVKMIPQVNVEETIPYLLTRYDSASFGLPNRVFLR
jgi:acetoacetate decarboxylase